MKPIFSSSFVGKAAALAIVASLAACTTTTRMSTVTPLPPNKTPTTESEVHVAETALASGNVELATNVYQHIVQVNPQSIDGLTGLGNTLYTVGDFTRAAVYYNKASGLDPKAVAPRIGAARVAIHQRRLDEAAALYREVLTISPDNPSAEAGLGSALDMKGDHAGAQAVLRQALQTHPGDPLLSIDLGLSLTLGGNPREGANVLLDVTRYPEAPPQARQDLALAYGLMGNTDAAATILGADLPKASVQDNLRFYEMERTRLQTARASQPTLQPVAQRTPQRSEAVAANEAQVAPVTTAAVSRQALMKTVNAATVASTMAPTAPAVRPAVVPVRAVATAQTDVPTAPMLALPTQLQGPLTEH